MRAPRSARDIAIALALACAVLLLALATGSQGISLPALWRALASAEPSLYADVVLDLRLPRALAAFAAGGLLAVAGALMQVLLRNPLADPYVLGLAGGAGSGALGAMLLGLDALATLGAAWTGALVSVALVVWFARRSFIATSAADEWAEPLRLLLTGIALAAGWAALITLILALAPDASLRGMLFWLMGDLDGAEAPLPALAGLALVLLLAWLAASELNVLTTGEERSRSLGVAVQRLRLLIMLLAAAATALAVTTVGAVGFVGLIVPNALRLASGNDQRVLLPLCALAGGALLTFADTLARSVVAPMQLPVGAVIAVLGVPAFIWLITRRAARP
ncbi:MAG: iron ABC transporter permease [Burkholderiales bacterium]|nr:iron ABC transporter permease [Burkholderiales bacterium]